MAKFSLLKKALDFVASQSTFNMANALIFTTSAGWLASSLAQIVGIYFNKNYTKEEKSYMIPQEFADALVNIGSFLVVTKSLKSLTTKMVQTGKLLPRSLEKFLGDSGMLSQRGNFDFDVTTVEGFNAYRQKYNSFKTVAESTAAIVGGVLSSNIITPILRNRIAASRKDRVMKSLNMDDSLNKPKNPTATSENTQVITVPPVRRTTQHSFDQFRTTALSI